MDRVERSSKGGRGIARGGSIDYLAKSSGLRSGPASVTEAGNWPVAYLEQLVADSGGDVRKRRFEGCLQHGVVMHTDFSGRASVEAAFELLNVATNEKDFHMPPDWFRSSRFAHLCFGTSCR